MKRNKSVNRGDVYWVDPNPIAGREMKDCHRFVVITPKEINALGVVMMVPITSGGVLVQAKGLTVPILGHNTTGVAVCNQVRTFDIESRVSSKTACYIETLDVATIDNIINRVISIIDPYVE
ncbi:MAG: type II toxin-antitoxin system PemK/MazF family toxin [Gammaproteobacteria bacterium]|nr:type II toxin-antitoxin system PemK/MazF family toxin [Gammaproteobacteria bacterium]